MPKIRKTKTTITIQGLGKIRHLEKTNKWVVDAGKKINGVKRFRKECDTLSEAKILAEQLLTRLKNQGTSGFRLSREEQVDAERAIRMVEGSRFKNLIDAVSFAIEVTNKEEAKSPKTIGELIEEKITDAEKKHSLNQRGGSIETIKELKHRGRDKFGKEFGEVRVCDFREKHFRPFWDRNGNSEQLLRVCKSIFGFCLDRYKDEESIIEKNPISITIRKGDRQKEPPVIFKADEWRRLIQTAIHLEDKECTKGNTFGLLAWVTLGLWCGIRPKAELPNILWENIYLNDDEPEVWVQPHLKVKHPRRVKIPPCAVSLLKLCKPNNKTITHPKNLKKRWDTLRKIAGVAYPIWKPDIMRHTYASMHYAKHQDKVEISKQLGHVTEDVLDHYLNHGKRLKEESKEFWNFTAPLPDQIDSLLKVSA
jgi:integrase